MALEQNGLIEELSQSELFQKIGLICANVNTVTDADELLTVSLKQVLDLFKAKRGSIFILKENSRDLVLKAAEGIEKKEEEMLVKKMGEGVVGRVAELKEPVFVDDISKDDRFFKWKSQGRYQTPSFICAPLLIKDQLIGVINITDKKCGSRFTQNDMQLLDFVTTQIALNYRRIQLYNKFKKVIKETQNLKVKLGKTDKEAQDLKQQVVVQERLATIGKLAGGIAHEFNNPLDGVMRYTNLCLEHTKEDDVTRTYLLEIKQGLNRMANIVKNLLACSRNEAPSKAQKVRIEQVVEAAVKGLQHKIVKNNIDVSVSIGKNLPLILDLGLDRILSNLISNAVDAMPEGGRLNITAQYEDPYIAVIVGDTGCGIDEKNINEIFEPFFTTKDMDKGCGLGLTIVDEIVKSYNGKITVQTKKGEGTAFLVYLPVTGALYEKQ